MKDNTGFFKTRHDPKHGWLLNNHPNKVLRGTEVEFNNIKYNITPGNQKVFTETSNILLKKNDKDREIYENILKGLILRIIKQ